MECKALIFSGHALCRMFERSVSPIEVRAAIDTGEIIEDYPDDTPYPSFLVLGHANGKPLHIVIGYNDLAKECYVITVYRPDPGQWENGFKVRITP